MLRASGRSSSRVPSASVAVAGGAMPPDGGCSRRASLTCDDLVRVQVVEAFELDRSLQVDRDALVRDAVRIAAHVVAKAGAVAPAADHDQFARLAIGTPDLEALEAVEAVDEAEPPAERVHELVGAIGLDPQP